MYQVMLYQVEEMNNFPLIDLWLYENIVYCSKKFCVFMFYTMRNMQCICFKNEIVLMIISFP